MRRDWYVSEALSKVYLGDEKTYQEVPLPPPLEPIVEKLTTICDNQTWLPKAKAKNSIMISR